ncbi:MAG: stalled ribosome rescue protein Dom34 [Cyclobacteriaceae bacterium]|jgi:stalled ribosome rescue protein Dom34
MNNKNLGIWMDHSTANLIDLNDSMQCHTIASDFTHNKKVDALHKSESLMNNIRQQLHEASYKEIAAEILKYNHVLLFGPTNAKTELHNYLNKDLHFKDIKIAVQAADNMTNNEQTAFVRVHFGNP